MIGERVRAAAHAPATQPVGAGRRGLQRAFSGRVSRHCLAHAVCPVLAVPPSPLESELLSVHRRNTWHLRIDTRGL